MSWKRFCPHETRAQLRLYYLLGKERIVYKSQQYVTVPDTSNQGVTEARFLVDVLLPFKVVVEVDGASHLLNQRQLEKDIWKNSCLKNAGYSVLRFQDRDVWKEPDRVINLIKQAVEHQKP